MAQWTSLAATVLEMPADERSLSDEQFAIVAKAASAPPPALPTASKEAIGRLLATMASTLKRARTDDDQGRLKAAAYARMLEHLPHAALKHATERAIATLEWMPTPAELLRIAQGFTAPQHRAHERAKSMSFNRRQRLFEQTLANIRDRKLFPEEIAALDEHTARVAETRGTLIIRKDGTREYRTREAILAHLAEIETDDATKNERPSHTKVGAAVGEVRHADTP